MTKGLSQSAYAQKMREKRETLGEEGIELGEWRRRVLIRLNWIAWGVWMPVLLGVIGAIIWVLNGGVS